MQDSPSQRNPEIAHFLSRNQVAVLATANKTTGEPNASVIYYTSTSQLNVFFVTKANTQKARNIKTNPLVALTVFEAANQATLAINGTAEEVDDPERLNSALEIMTGNAKKSSDTEVLPISRLDAGNYVLYKITPTKTSLTQYKYTDQEHMTTYVLPPTESLDQK